MLSINTLAVRVLKLSHVKIFGWKIEIRKIKDPQEFSAIIMAFTCLERGKMEGRWRDKTEGEVREKEEWAEGRKKKGEQEGYSAVLVTVSIIAYKTVTGATR